MLSIKSEVMKMDRKKAREIMREHQSGFVKLNPRWCAIEKLIKDSEKLEKIEQIVNSWNNDASHCFEDMCKINGILKE